MSRFRRTDTTDDTISSSNPILTGVPSSWPVTSTPLRDAASVATSVTPACPTSRTMRDIRRAVLARLSSRASSTSSGTESSSKKSSISPGSHVIWIRGSATTTWISLKSRSCILVNPISPSSSMGGKIERLREMWSDPAGVTCSSLNPSGSSCTTPFWARVRSASECAAESRGLLPGVSSPGSPSVSVMRLTISSTSSSRVDTRSPTAFSSMMFCEMSRTFWWYSPAFPNHNESASSPFS